MIDCCTTGKSICDFLMAARDDGLTVTVSEQKYNYGRYCSIYYSEERVMLEVLY